MFIFIALWYGNRMVQGREKGLKLNYKTQFLVDAENCRLFFPSKKNKHSKRKTEGQLLASKGVRPDTNVEKTKYTE